MGDQSVWILFHRFWSSVSNLAVLRGLWACHSLEKDWHHASTPLLWPGSNQAKPSQWRGTPDGHVEPMADQWQSHQASSGGYFTKALRDKHTNMYILHLHSITTQYLFVIHLFCLIYKVELSLPPKVHMVHDVWLHMALVIALAMLVFKHGTFILLRKGSLHSSLYCYCGTY